MCVAVVVTRVDTKQCVAVIVKRVVTLNSRFIILPWYSHTTGAITCNAYGLGLGVRF